MSQSCAVPITSTTTVEGIPYTGNSDLTIRNPQNAVDADTNSRFVSNGPTTVTKTFSQPVTQNWIYMKSGFNGGSPNQTLTLTVDGRNVPLNFDKKVKFTKAINETGRVFKAVTTGTGGLSRVFDLRFSK